MTKRTHLSWRCSLSNALLYVTCGLTASCANTTRPEDDAGRTSVLNPNAPRTLDDGGADASARSADAATSTRSGATTASESSEDPVRTGENLDLPNFGGVVSDAGTPSRDLEPTTALAPSGDAGTTLAAPETAGPTRDPDSGAALPCGPCPASEDACALAVCNPVTSLCEAAPNPGAACDDGNPCTLSDVCDAEGACAGTSRECPASDNPCAATTCNPVSGACEERALPPNTTCDDGDGCTAQDSCDGAGRCAGVAKDCSALTDQCLTGACNPESGECEARGDRQDEACDDEDPCTLLDACNTDGVCVGVTKDCSQHDSACVVGACNATSGACEPQNVADGSVCDDGSLCTMNDACKSGSCSGVFADTCANYGVLELRDGSAFVSLDTSCTGIANQFNIASYSGLPLPLPGGPANVGDCVQSTGPDVFLLLDLSSYDEAIRVVATTDHESTLFDTVLALMGSDANSDKQCAYTRLAACNDDISNDKKQSRIDVVVDPGLYVLIVDGFVAKDKGVEGLRVRVTPP